MVSLIASYFVQSSGTSTATLTTSAFTPDNGEVIIVKGETWDTNVSLGSITGGGQTYTSRATVAPGGFAPWVGIYRAVISGSPGSMTISATPSGSARYSMCVERWGSAQLAGTPATGTRQANAGVANASVTTTGTNSVVSWVASDASSTDPAGRTYLSSATDEGVRDGHAGANGVGYHAWQAAATAGSQTFGLTTATGMALAGIEVQNADVTQSVTPTGLAIPLTLGSPSVSQMIVTLRWLAVPIAFGTVTLSQSQDPSPTPLPSGNGWWGLKGILDTARQELADDAARPPVACPHDGRPLLVNVDGVV